jgi:hypothetical protein
VLSRRLLCALPAVLLLAGCGGDDTKTPAAKATATPARAADAPAGRFPDHPQVDVDFTTGEQGLAAVHGPAGTAALVGDSFLVQLARTGSLRAPAGQAAEPGSAGVSVVGTIRRPERLQGRAGVFCRGSADGRSGYELTVDRAGRARVERVEDGRRTLTAGFRAVVDRASPPGTPVPVVLTCGIDKDAQITLGFTVGARQLTYVRDPRPLEPGPSGGAGLVATGARGAKTRFGALQLYLAE